VGEEFKSFFDARGVEGDCPGEIPIIGMTHRFGRGSREKMVGLEVVEACRVVAELVVK